jgi:pantothenate kinase type III
MAIEKFNHSFWRREILRCSRVVVFGVVPRVVRRILSICRAANVPCRELQVADIPVRVAYQNGIGIDRVLNVYAAYRRVRRACVVIDFGTAVTAEFVSAQGAHVGGFIVVGPRLALKALSRGTALLPLVPALRRTDAPRVGNSTKTCIEYGQLHLYRGFLREIELVASRLLGKSFRIVLTGGSGKIFASRRMPYVEELGLRSLPKIRVE